MDGVALKGLTVDFHETGFVAQIAGENGQPFWFQMSDEQRGKAGSPWGPANPQGLNRYSYVQNNPLRYVDPTGHFAALIVGVLAGVGITISAPLIAAIAAVIEVAALAIFLSDENNRAWLSRQIEQGVSNVNGFVNDLTQKIQNSTALMAKKEDIRYVEYLVKKYGLTREQRRQLHDYITKGGYSKQAIEQEAKDIKNEGKDDSDD